MLFLGALILLAVAQRCGSPPIRCSVAADATEVDLSGCGLQQLFVDVIPKTARILRLSNNILEKIDPKSIADLRNLQEVDLSDNHYLIVPNDTCFLESETTEYLDLSYIDLFIHPVALKCMPHLIDLILLGNKNCKTINTLLQNEKLNITVHCKRDELIGSRYQVKATDAARAFLPNTNSTDTTSKETPTQGTIASLPEDVATTAGDTNKSDEKPNDKPAVNNWYILGIIVGIVVVAIVIGLVIYGCYLYNCGYYPVN